MTRTQAFEVRCNRVGVNVETHHASGAKQRRFRFTRQPSPEGHTYPTGYDVIFGWSAAEAYLTGWESALRHLGNLSRSINQPGLFHPQSERPTTPQQIAAFRRDAKRAIRRLVPEIKLATS